MSDISIFNPLLHLQNFLEKNVIKALLAFVTRVGVVVSMAGVSLGSLAATEFYYTSSPASWVGQGETVSVSPDLGFEFIVSRNFDNGISFSIRNDASGPAQSSWWYLDFAAPSGVPLSVGSYLGATRWPFQDAEKPGLSFSGNGRGNNRLTGMFNVLEVEYSPAGEVASFAADFLQYDEGIESWWNQGSIRYNSDIAISVVPEPASHAVFAMGLIALFALQRRRNAA